MASNPYKHLPTQHLKAQLRLVSSRLTMNSIGKRTKGSPEYMRAIMMSISAELESREEVDFLNQITEFTEN